MRDRRGAVLAVSLLLVLGLIHLGAQWSRGPRARWPADDTRVRPATAARGFGKPSPPGEAHWPGGHRPLGTSIWD